MPDTPLIDREALVSQNDNYTPNLQLPDKPNVPFQHLDSAMDTSLTGGVNIQTGGEVDYLKDLNNKVSSASDAKSEGK
jgi:hypothetical protein